MRHLLPRSLFGQTILILLLGLAVSHAIGAWFYGSDREQVVRAVGGLVVAQRVANNARLIDEAPPEWRSRIIEALSDPAFRVSLSPEAPVFPPEEANGPISDAIRDFIAGQLPVGPMQNIRIAVSLAPGQAPVGPPFGFRGPMPPPGQAMHRGMHGGGPWRGLRAAVGLSDGSWLTFATGLPEGGPPMSVQFILSMAIMAIIVLAVSIWTVRRLTSPLGVLAAAAERLGKDVAAPPLAEVGTIEMRRAAQAFNRMQERLRRMIENRTVMLAAISHDIRTPLTLLRLRAESLEAGEDRERMLATIAEMDVMLTATLGFIRDEARAESRRKVDVAALIASLVDDMADAGLPVSMEPAGSAIRECQSQGLRRALANLIDNAVKYGFAARIGMRQSSEALEITVDDGGPGIPEAELGRVTQPFYRLEGSRNRDTGGTGLGLAITLSIIQAHGGELILANRPEGGLRASVTLPA